MTRWGIIEIEEGRDDLAAIVVELTDPSSGERLPVTLTRRGPRAMVRWPGDRAESLAELMVGTVPVTAAAVSATSAVFEAIAIGWRRAVRRPATLFSEAAGVLGFLIRRSGLGACAASRIVPSLADVYARWVRANESTTPPASAPALSSSLVCLPASSYLPSVEECRLSLEAMARRDLEVCFASPDEDDLPSQDEAFSWRPFRTSPDESWVSVLNGVAAQARGEILVFVEPGTIVGPRMGDAFAEAFRKDPDAVLAFADDDEIGEDGFRLAPRFKPVPGPDDLTSGSWLGPVVAVRRSAFEEAGGFRGGAQGADLYALALRFAEDEGVESLAHVPEVLSHRVSERLERESDRLSAFREALEAQVGSEGLVSELEGGPADRFRVQYRIGGDPLVSTVILTRDRADLLETCVESFCAKTNYERYEIVIVDNGSVEEATFALFERLASRPGIRIVRDEREFNFSALNNAGVKLCEGEHLLFLNNDIEIFDGDWLGEMLGHSARAETGCVGAKLLYPSGLVQHAGIVTGLGGIAGHPFKYFARDGRGYLDGLRLVRNVSAVTAACLLVKREAFDEVQGFREELSVAYNDVDLCLRVMDAGYENVWTPFAELIHHESMSRGRDDSAAKRARLESESQRMRELWGDRLASDPYYSPHLTLAREDVSF